MTGLKTLIHHTPPTNKTGRRLFAGHLFILFLLAAAATPVFAQSNSVEQLPGIETEAGGDTEGEAGIETTRTSSDPTLSCFVDTSAYDQFTPGGCIGFEFDGPRTTSAVFQVFNVDPATHSFVWSAYGCSGYQCVTSVTAYRPKVVDVTVTNNQTGQQWLLSAEAIYENGY